MTDNKKYRIQLEGQYKALEEHIQKLAKEREKQAQGFWGPMDDESKCSWASKVCHGVERGHGFTTYQKLHLRPTGVTPDKLSSA